jgi:2-polyprenyl-3-methyl-5-hydroxy-6-metoxy-1,4-benzoquinol methylase
MSKFAVRSHAVEIMDDLSCSGEVVDQSLKELDFINKWLGGNPVTLEGVDRLLAQHKISSSYHLHLADIGCGSGTMLNQIAASLTKKNIPFTLTGIDANPNIIAYAANTFSNNTSIAFRSENIFEDSFRSKSFDIVTATLFLHHFTGAELTDILRTLKQQVKFGIVINDLHRHPLAYYSIRLLTRLFSKSDMVKFDGPLSVLRGFSRQEWVEILEAAGIKTYSIKWKWAFRWQVIIPVNTSEITRRGV